MQCGYGFLGYPRKRVRVLGYPWKLGTGFLKGLRKTTHTHTPHTHSINPCGLPIPLHITKPSGRAAHIEPEAETPSSSSSEIARAISTLDIDDREKLMEEMLNGSGF